MSLSKRLKTFGRRCVDKIGGLLGHPVVVRVLISIAAWFVVWVLKLLVIALLSTAGMALPVG